jgi:hypothetical protein
MSWECAIPGKKSVSFKQRKVCPIDQSNLFSLEMLLNSEYTKYATGMLRQGSLLFPY